MKNPGMLYHEHHVYNLLCSTDLLEEFLQKMVSSHPDRAEVLCLQYANCCEVLIIIIIIFIIMIPFI